MFKVNLTLMLFLVRSLVVKDITNLFCAFCDTGLFWSPACPVNFEFMNYTIITSQCKGPRYPAKLCCDAFKDFACPYYEELNDLSNECSTTMFSYINLYGNYPPGLFSSLCQDDKIGLICPALAPGSGRNSVGDSNNGHNIRSPSILLTLSVGFLAFVFRWF